MRPFCSYESQHHEIFRTVTPLDWGFDGEFMFGFRDGRA